jgi:hypothetical protein
VPIAFASFLAMHQVIRDANTHSQLQDDLVEHLWMLKGNAAKFYYLFSIYLDLKLCIICVYKLCFYNLYESSGTIFQVSRRSGAILADSAQRQECPHLKKLGQIYAYLGRIGLLESRMGVRLGKHRPHTPTGAGAPPPIRRKNCLHRTPYWGRVEMLRGISLLVDNC